MPEPKTVVFLGAGASCADGAPPQGELFREYFSYYNGLPKGRLYHNWDRELATFFLIFFGINVDDRDEVATARFPTFEEVLGTLEIAVSRAESFRDWGTSHELDPNQKPRIQHLHDILIFLIAEILDHKLKHEATHHPQLVMGLYDAGWLAATTFISLNYDILIDNALIGARDRFDLDLDYSIEFSNFNGEWTRPRAANRLSLFKLHGSLNWLFCPTCRAIRITPKDKGICRLKWEPEQCLCLKCQTLAVPIIIPPTYFKVLANLYLTQIWHSAEAALQDCDRIVFCGYSFPDADVHIRYLLKRMEVNSRKNREIFVVNEHRDKTDEARKLEQNRFHRFFRDKSRVHWTNLSFEEFAEKPVVIL